MAIGKEGGSTKGKKEGKGECRRWGEGGAHKCKKEKFLGNWGSVRLDEGGQSKEKSTCFDCFRIANFAPKKDGPQAIDEQGALGHRKANGQTWRRGDMIENQGTNTELKNKCYLKGSLLTTPQL